MKWDYVLIGMFLLLTIGLGLIFVILNRKQVSVSALAGDGTPPRLS